jgi:hypothetical protein
MSPPFKQSHLLCVSQNRWRYAIDQKMALSIVHSPSLETRIIGTKKKLEQSLSCAQTQADFNTTDSLKLGALKGATLFVYNQQLKRKRCSPNASLFYGIQS